MTRRFCKFFATEEELEAFRERTVNAEVYRNISGDPTKVKYTCEAVRSNLPWEMRFTHPFCLAYDGVVKRKKPHRFLPDDTVVEVEDSEHTLH